MTIRDLELNLSIDSTNTRNTGDEAVEKYVPDQRQSSTKEHLSDARICSFRTAATGT